MTQQSITVFRSRVRDDVPPAYDELSEALEARAATFDGFVEFKMFHAADGERLALVTFASDGAEAAWANDAGHRDAQRRGREEFLTEYDVAVCSVQRRHAWRASDR